MPTKYHIAVESAPHRFPTIPPVSRIELDGCLGCLECVKRTACIFDVYREPSFDLLGLGPQPDEQCVNCLRCVQECKKGIILRAPNPQFQWLGNEYWTPERIQAIWRQAEDGKIPVSGAGYRGPFVGPGFDQMWTDMSEIVRPTRDGIHGREYISTSIDLGRRPDRLVFDGGRMTSELPALGTIPMPVVLELPDRGIRGRPVLEALARAAENLQTLAVAPFASARAELAPLRKQLLVQVGERDAVDEVAGATMVELAYGARVADRAAALRDEHPELVVSVRLDLDEHAVERTRHLVDSGVGVIHLRADAAGQGLGSRRDSFLSELLLEVHGALVDDGVREQVSLLATGGIALPEHVAKAIVCGADGVGVDVALVVALECRLCRRCDESLECPVNMESLPTEWGAQRITNLLGAWHSQLIELLGAMGLREVRRLRGELGRAMFFEDLERESFAPIFGERRADAEPLPPSIASKPGSTDARTAAGSRVPSCASRFRNAFGRYRVVRTSACTACGTCAEVCRYGVHVKGGGRLLRPRSHLCVGGEVCEAAGRYCVPSCPEQALRVGPDPVWETIGDSRWPADLLAATWHQAETGRPPDNGLEYRVGASGGGFDRIHFRFPESLPDHGSPDEIGLRIPLNRTGDGRPEVSIGLPIYGGGMSFGSVSLSTIVARARAYTALDSFTCTGEGGFPDALIPYEDHVITQVATGLFGVREETIQRVRMVEFKYAQGAKPGLGGHLLGSKNTPIVARMREAVEGTPLFSPFPFHSVYSVEDHKKHVDWIRLVNPRALVSVKVSTPTDVDMVAVGSYHAGAHVVHIDGSYGGTGAAPDVAKKNIAMPIEYAIPKVHRFLVREGLRDVVTLIASGGLRTAWDVAKAIALGADGVVIGTAEMVALECVRCGVCERGRGCPRGIATTDGALVTQFDEQWGEQRLTNLLNAWAAQLREILWRLGLGHVRELVGRSDLLRHQDYRRAEA
ncbi:MAG: glutamate synthase-related protein [bacterium]